MGETVQLEILEGHDCKVIYTEPRRGLDERINVITSLRHNDELCVSHLHRLGTGQRDLSEVIKAVISQGATIIEVSTGRHSNDPASLVTMIQDANSYYAHSLTSERAQEIGKLGAAASPMTKRRRGRMPIKNALIILNDHKRYPTLVDAITAINKDKRYGRPWNVPLVYRLKKDGINIKDRQ